MLFLNGELVEVRQFPNGESYIDIEIEEDSLSSLFNMYGGLESSQIIKMKYESDSDLMGLVYLTDYLKDLGKEVELVMPYIPYSRMDRKEGKRLFTLKSLCKLINSLCFKSVTVCEPHSDVSVGLLDRVKVENTTYKLTIKKMYELADKEYKYIQDLYKEMNEKGVFLVYPDAGASKRYSKQFNYPNVIECNKERDFESGRIKKLTLNSNSDFSECKVAIIVDDLCSKGGTFLMTAKALREKGIEEIYLVVTHCENTIFEGELLTTDYIKEIITTDSILTGVHEKIIKTLL